MMSDGKQIFISYSRRDGNTQAEHLERELQAKGFRVWRDVRDIDPAKDFTADIERGIEESAQVVVCVTPDSKRDDSFVRREIQYALLSEKPVIPVRFAEIKPHLPIINYEWIDVFRDWDDRFARLCAILAGEAREFQQRQVSDDPFRPYVETLYKRVVNFLGQAVIKLIDLTSEATPDAVNTPPSRKDMIDLFFEVQGIGEEKPSKLKPFHTFAEAFEYYKGRVLLLGEPGAGKTITLFATARDAAARRLNDPTAPLPLLGLISSWDAEKQIPLADWLSGGYPELDSDLVRQTIAEGEALLLLDGLDELGGEGRKTISKVEYERGNEKTHPLDVIIIDDENKQVVIEYDPRKRFLTQIVVNSYVILSCRAKDYQEIGQKVVLYGAVILRPLNEIQMQTYLSEQPELWAAVQSDESLKEMLQTPLLLSFFAFAYHDMTDTERESLTTLGTNHDVLGNMIFERYIHGRFKHEERKTGRKLTYDYSTLQRVLGEIASQDARSVFYENKITKREIANVLGHEPYKFIDQCCLLHILIPVDNYTLRFMHLRLRDYFAFAPLLAELYDEDIHIQLSAASALGRIGDVRAIEPLIEIMGSRDVYFDDVVGDAIGNIGEPTVKPLLVALHDVNPARRLNAAFALKHIRDVRAIKPLVAALNDKKWFVRNSIVVALANMRDFVVEELFIVLNSSDRDVRISGIDALGRIKSTQATKALINMLHDTDEHVRYHATFAIGQIRDAISIGALSECLNDVSEWVCKGASVALENIGTPEALEALQKWREEQGNGMSEDGL